ncbi:MAG: methyltransferase domain-containing protein [Candidatus Micrarchaeota archaeon]|nr:methyltransferase domain-containing protein [Candidatus Micrarchaeota archaeon]
MGMFIYPKMYRKLKRGPQVILPKDIGMIIAYAGVNKESVCVDAGTGSGWLAVSLAKIAKKVTSYDTREDFTAIAKKNKEMLGLENLALKKGDVTKKIAEKNVDVLVLDLPGSDKALSNAKKSLKIDGIVVGYLPNMEQVKAFVKKLNTLKFAEVHTIEVVVREMLVRKEGMRPTNTGLWHTAYLVFARKV